MKVKVLPRKRSRWVVGRGLLIGLWLFAGTLVKPEAIWAQLIQQVGPRPGPAVGRAAIGFNLKTLDGKSITLESFHGKPLVVNFFASWCDPCREEMPLVNELAAESGKEGYNVLGIAVEDSRAAVTEYAQEAKLVFPIALDLNSVVKRSYRIFGPPATFFVDGQGIVREIIMGPMSRERALQALKQSGAAAKN